MKRVLFLSTRNAARSLMAEAWLNLLGGNEYTAESAGRQPADAVHRLAIEVMRDAGVDLSSARPRSSAGLSWEAYDLVIVLTPRAGEPAPHLRGAREVVYWSFDDPHEAQGRFRSTSLAQALTFGRPAAETFTDRSTQLATWSCAANATSPLWTIAVRTPVSIG